MISSSVIKTTKLFGKSGLKPAIFSHSNGLLLSSFHTTPKRLDLNEFVEPKENWGKEEIKVGRSWKKDELRIKSNEDLHQLWYVLLKEKNMLLTMEHYHKENHSLFPNPERIDKVEESMSNLENVIRERNRAYFLLETGSDGERPAYISYNQIGMEYFYKSREHLIPEAYNKEWRVKNPHRFEYHECIEFLRLMDEKKLRRKNFNNYNIKKHIQGLCKRFKNLDIEVLQKQFPDIDVKQIVDQERDEFVESHSLAS